ncbi:MAG: hypothetical protein WBX15_14890, partial [Thermoanaerobaculia bacterium]
MSKSGGTSSDRRREVMLQSAAPLSTSNFDRLTPESQRQELPMKIDLRLAAAPLLVLALACAQPAP